MGLDNMFFIRDKRTHLEVDCAEVVPNCSHFMNGADTHNIMYMRKYWGVRNKIMKYLEADEMDYAIPVAPPQIEGIIDILWKFTDKKYFEDNGGSTIWEWEETLRNLLSGICNLKIIAEDMKSGLLDTDRYELVFLDSF